MAMPYLAHWLPVYKYIVLGYQGG